VPVDFATVERAARAGEVRLEVVRHGARRQVTVAPEPLDLRGTRRALLWAGAILQATPRAASAQRGVPPGGVYVASRFAGSPAARHDLRPTLRIRAVDGEPTPDLDAFLAAVAGREDRSALRLRTEDLEGRTRMQTLQLDLRYWPTVEWVFREDAEGGAWIRRGPDS